jgi:hypothetical protein
MRLKIEGEENYAPEIFARAEQLVWHYGLFSVLNDRSIALRAKWFEEQGEESARILVLAGRSLFYNRHICSKTCVELPMSPWDVISRGSYMCQHCDRPFDPISTRYLCPYDDCKMKNTCCE